jgi:hypothetical protein
VIESFAANVRNNGGVYFSETIEDMEIYKSNKSVADSDYASFKTKVLSAITS